LGITFNPFTGNLDISGSAGPLVITDTFVVNSEAEMLALTVQRGDLAVRTDLSKTFILQGDDPTVLSNWVELATPPDAVTSVNTKVGAVVLDKTDIGLGNVDNTSDLDKPISTATQDALDLKYDASNPANYVDAAGAAAAAPVQSVNSMNGNVQLNATDIPYSNPYVDPDFTATNSQTAIDQLYLKAQAANVSDVTKEPTGFVDRTSSSLQFDDLSREFRIIPSDSIINYYIHGVLYQALGTKTVTIPNTSGEYFIYFGTDTNLHTLPAFSPTLFSEYAFVSIVYWNAETQSHTYLADERHGLTMDAATHSYLHTIFGARFVSGHALQGFQIGPGTLDPADAKFTVDSGTIRDEDIIFQSPAQLQIPILYRQGQYWRKKEADDYPVIYQGTAGYGANKRLPYNQYVDSITGWQLTEANQSSYVLVHFFATNDVENPVIGIQGTAQHTSISDARTSANLEIASLSGLPFTEFVAIGSVIFQTSNSFILPTKAAVTPTDTGANYVDFRGTELYTPAGEATTHGLLSGLSSDDHLQYLLTSGTRAMTGNLNMDTHAVSNVTNVVPAVDLSGELGAYGKRFSSVWTDYVYAQGYDLRNATGETTYGALQSNSLNSNVVIEGSYAGGGNTVGINLITNGLPVKFNGNLDLTNSKITNVLNPVDAQDVATKNYVDTADALKVAKAGDVMSGTLVINDTSGPISTINSGIIELTNDPGDGSFYTGRVSTDELKSEFTDIDLNLFVGRVGPGSLDAWAETSADGLVSEVFAEALATGAAQLSVKNLLLNNFSTIDPGQISLFTNNVASIPTLDEHVATKKYVDDSIIAIPTVDLTPYLKKDGTILLEGNLSPDGDGTRDLGTLAARYGNVYANILKSSDYHYVQPFTGITIQDPNSPTNTYQVMDWTGGFGVSIQGYLGISLSTIASSSASININSNNISLNSTGGDIFLNTVTTGTNVVVNSKITGVSPGTLGTDAVNLNQLNAATSDKLSLSGGTMTGEINMGSNAITNASTISDSALNTSIDVNARVLVYPSGSAGAFGWYQAGELACYGNKLIGVADPVASDDAATKNYVDSAIKAHWDIIVGSPAEVSQGIANTLAMNLASAIASFGPQARVLVLKGNHTITGGLNLTSEILIQGQGRSSVLIGSITLNTGSSYSTINKIKVDGTVIINSNGNFFTENFLANGGSVVDNGSSNYKVYIEE